MAAAAPSNDDLKAAIDKVPEAHSEFIPIMTAEMTLVLLEHSTCDHAIDLKDGTTPPWGPIYPLNEAELEELRKWCVCSLATSLSNYKPVRSCFI